MKLLFKKLLSMQEDGAVCFLLILDEQFTIMLDCGLNHKFDFSKYRQAAAELKNVQLVLISHSTLEYSGAYPFLISELAMSPKMFYTTQPIMRYCPLNIHEEILNLRLPGYNKKIFNRIYSYFEEMHLLKPFQKKEITLVSR
jgi:Cft2 family RNA processing exonuclease